MARTAELRLYSPRDSQRWIFSSNARFLIEDAGRRWGKTLTAINWILDGAWRDKGENWWVAPVYKQGKIAWRRMVNGIPKEAVRDTSKSELRMELLSGGVIEVRSADNPETLRGEGLKRLIIDEAARVQREVWEDSLRPALSDTGGRCLFITTPKGRNWIFDLWTRGQDHIAFPEYESYKHPSSDNPIIPSEDIDEAKRNLPDDVFRQEYLAEFLEDSAGVFRNIRACTKDALQKPVPGATYYAGLDLARLTDFTVLTILDSQKHLCYFDRFNTIDWAFQRSRIIEAIKSYQAKLVVDSTGMGGDIIYEDLRKAGLNIQGFAFTSETKKDLIQNLAIGFEQEKLSIPKIKELINELMIFEYEMGKTGNVRYSAPEGYHDDCVISLALAYWCATKTFEPRIRWV